MSILDIKEEENWERQHRFFDQNLGHIDDMELKKALDEANEQMRKALDGTHDEFQPDSIVQNISERFIERAKKGWTKYGTNLDRKDLDVGEWIEHLQDELHDAYLYSEKLKQENTKRERLLELCMHLLDYKAPRALSQEEKDEWKILTKWYNEQKEKIADSVVDTIL
jgi:hypothetical protein